MRVLENTQFCDIGRIDVMDPALLRPGRFGQLMYVPLPSPDERGVILKALCRKRPIDANVDLMALGKDTRLNNFSGADLNYLVSLFYDPN